MFYGRTVKPSRANFSVALKNRIPDVSACEMEAVAMSYKNDNVSVLLYFASKARNIQFLVDYCIHHLNGRNYKFVHMWLQDTVYKQ